MSGASNGQGAVHTTPRITRERDCPALEFVFTLNAEPAQNFHRSFDAAVHAIMHGMDDGNGRRRVGYSSLVMLGDVRPDFVKLDKGLTMAVLDDSFRAVIAEKVIEVALSTGMKIVAEGIETAASGNWFASRGVHYLQGYHFAQPAAVPPRLFAH